MSIPQLSEEQRQAARSAATQARRRRADLKAQVAAGTLSLGDALDLCLADDVLAKISVESLLRSVPRVGEKRAAAIMERHEIAINRRIRGLGHRQIAGLKEDFS